MTDEQESSLRDIALVYFAMRAIPPDDTLTISVEEIAAMYVYLNPKALRREIA